MWVIRINKAIKQDDMLWLDASVPQCNAQQKWWSFSQLEICQKHEETRRNEWKMNTFCSISTIIYRCISTLFIHIIIHFLFLPLYANWGGGPKAVWTRIGYLLFIHLSFITLTSHCLLFSRKRAVCLSELCVWNKMLPEARLIHAEFVDRKIKTMS